MRPTVSRTGAAPAGYLRRAPRPEAALRSPRTLPTLLARPGLAAAPLWLALAACAGADPDAPSDPADPDATWLAWGDLHAHSALSFDGCERADADCTHGVDGPAADFFAAADAALLDFVALTDHAEADRYAWAADAVHATGGEVEVWPTQQQRVLDAAGGPVLPLLGYEWTAVSSDDSDGPGTHRTVLLSDPQACAAYRLSGQLLDDGQHLPDRGQRAYYQDDPRLVRHPAVLWAALAEAAVDADCPGDGPAATRWITFAHHPAYAHPQETDWSDPGNAPIFEQLVEIHSEHGSSECLDPAADGCTWAVNLAQGYSPQGSVQAALDQGYRLGFLAGTDGHDALPGSLDDGPSRIGQWPGSDPEPIQQFAPGGLSGVLLDIGADLDTDTLFDALQARRTVATSGPRPDLRAYAEAADGRRWLPGALLPDDALPVRLVVEVGALDPAGSLRDEQVAGVAIERLGPGGVVLDRQEGDRFEGPWDPRGSDGWTYLRVRWQRAEPGVTGLDEERLWLSPWFVEPAGCSAAPASASLAALLFPLVLLTRRRLTPRSGRSRRRPRPAQAAPAPSTTTAARVRRGR